MYVYHKLNVLLQQAGARGPVIDFSLVVFFSARPCVCICLTIAFVVVLSASYMVYAIDVRLLNSLAMSSLCCVLFVLNAVRMAGSNRLKSLMAPTQNKRGFHAFVLLFGSQLFICVYTLYSPRFFFLLSSDIQI